MKPVNEAAVTFLSRSANEGFARTTAACFAAQLDPTLEEVNDIKTAVSEAVTNCIVHAYPDTLGKVSMRLRMFEDNVLEIVVKDWGWALPTWSRPGRPCLPPGTRAAPAWALPLWRVLWTGSECAPRRGRGPR